MQRTSTMPSVANAQWIAATEEAARAEVPYNVAVVDQAGRLIAHARIDGAWLGSVGVEVLRAWEARALPKNCQEHGRAEPPLIGITSADQGMLVIFAGDLAARRAARALPDKLS